MDSDEGKHKVLARLKRAEGQLRAVISMAEEDQDCERVAQQLAAVRKALDRAFFDMMACAMQQELASSKVTAGPDLDKVFELLRKYG